MAAIGAYERACEVCTYMDNASLWIKLNNTFNSHLSMPL